MARSFDCADVVVVGGGAAGCLAAIAAKEARPDADVVIMEKASVRRGGSIGCGMDAINVVVIPGVTSVEELVRAQLAAAEGILDRSVVQAVGEESFAVLQCLEAWGMEFPRDGAGNYAAFKQWSRRDSRGAVTSISMAGDLKVILDREVERRGVRRFEHSPVTAVLTVDGRAAGVSAFHVRRGEFIVLPARSVILAAGSGARFGLPESGYLHGTFDCPACAGDSYALGFRAGAQLVNMECTKLMIAIRHFNGPALAPLSHGGRLVNAFGDALLRRASGDQLELVNYMDLFSAVWHEYHEGRGPVYIDTRHFSPDTIRELERCFFTTERPTFRRFFEDRGLKFGHDLLEVKLSEPVLCGGHGINGLKVNARAETNVPGLYAAGDAAANANTLMGAFVLGRIAGREAVRFAADARPLSLDAAEVEAERQRVLAPLQRGGDLSPALLEQKVRRTVNEYLAGPKSGPKLQRARARLASLRDDIPRLRAVDAHDAMKAVEAQAILDCAEMAVVASLERKESRWGVFHHRVDYPERDDQRWLQFVIVQRDAAAGPRVSTEPVSGGQDASRN